LRRAWLAFAARFRDDRAGVPLDDDRSFFANPLIRGALLLLGGLLLAIGVRHALRSTGVVAQLEHAVVAKVDPPPAIKILFVGNSFSAPIPPVFGPMALAAGARVELGAITPGGASLEDHAASPETRRMIATGSWNVVVLQEQSQRPAFAEEQRQREMYAPGNALVNAVRAAGATPWLYATHALKAGDLQNTPGDTYSAMQTRIDSGYAALAKLSGTPIVPAGAAWRKAWQSGPPIELWAPDGRHPGAAGTYLIASVFLAALLQVDPSEVPYDAGLPAQDARALRRIAKETVTHELHLALHAPREKR
jgi:hypothetical protein